MKKYLKTFAAVLMVFSGAMTTAKFFTQPVSYTSMLYGVAGILILYPAIGAYIKWFDNLFGE
jgi:hypothetical protein